VVDGTIPLLNLLRIVEALGNILLDQKVTRLGSNLTVGTGAFAGISLVGGNAVGSAPAP
jgi:hypothetical protein